MVSQLITHLRIEWWLYIFYVTLFTSYILAGSAVWFDAFLLALTLSFLSSYAFLDNDLCDQKCDRINKTAGNGHDITEETELTTHIIRYALVFVAILSASLLGSNIPIVVVLTIAMLYLYNRLQYVTPLAVLLTAYAATLTVLLPLSRWGELVEQTHFVAVAIVFVSILAREVAADIQDYAGDREAGKKTIATIFSPYTAYKTVTALTALVVILALFFSIASVVEGAYLPAAAALLYGIFTILVTQQIGAYVTRTIMEHFMRLSRLGALLIPFLFL